MPHRGCGSSNCTHGGSPVYAVNVSSVVQTRLAVNFARNANLRLVIKNTGHCYPGKSNGAGALSIWTNKPQGRPFLSSSRNSGIYRARYQSRRRRYR